MYQKISKRIKEIPSLGIFFKCVLAADENTGQFSLPLCKGEFCF
jgi:hypothetical protein